MIKRRHILLFLLVMLYANCITVAACNGVCNFSPFAFFNNDSVSDCIECNEDCLFIDSDEAQDNAELNDYEQPYRLCSTRPVRVLSSRVGGWRLSLGDCGGKYHGRMLKNCFGGELHCSTFVSFAMRFYASERVVALRRIIC